jgi:hypothetical protein
VIVEAEHACDEIRNLNLPDGSTSFCVNELTSFEVKMMNSTNPPVKKPEPRTEADAKSIDGQSGQGNKTSHDAKSHTKAGTDQGAGGGKKQERHH